MKNNKFYYSASIVNFLSQSNTEILGEIFSNESHAETRLQQTNTWEAEIKILKQQLAGLTEGRIIFEYTIPRMGKRVDVVVLHSNIVYILEFKCGDAEYKTSTYDQVYDYALDLRNFQKESHDKLLVPIIVATKAPEIDIDICENERIITPIKCNAGNIRRAIDAVNSKYFEAPFDYILRQNSEYLPTPTIVEAAQALYRGHNVHEITRNDAGAKNLTITTAKVN